MVEIHHPEGTTVEVGTPIIAIDTDPSAGELPGTTSVPSGDLPEPSAASLAAVEIAPAEGMVEPGLIGGAAPGGRTAVLVGYGPRTTAAKRRPRKDGGAAPAAEASVAAPVADSRSAVVSAPVVSEPVVETVRVSGRWPSRRCASWPATSASTSTG